MWASRQHHSPQLHPPQFRGGPITLAEYVSEVLTNAAAGYYTRRDVFGVAGDFITSPEISQMFGEMMGIWAVAAWQAAGSPPAARLVELGPGRGTLMADLLRGTAPFAGFTASLSIALVEISPVLRKMQWEALGCVGEWSADAVAGVTPAGVAVTWHRSLEEVPEDGKPIFVIAHEFLDALPVHQFQKTAGGGWGERLVGEAPPGSKQHFQLVLSPGPTPASRALLPLRLQGLPLARRAALDALEVCPQGMALAEALARRVAASGGAALLIDYGQDGPYAGSLQAIKGHAQVGLFETPGDADLSAWVDFDALRLAVARSGGSAEVHGPITQERLLHGLGIRERLQTLLDAAPGDDVAEGLVKGYLRLVGGSSQRGSTGNKEGEEEEVDGMGESYKAVCISAKGAPPPPPFGPPA